MFGKASFASWLATLLLIAPVLVLSQATDQRRMLTINGQSTQVPVIQMNGLSYVGLEGLAEALHGSISYSGNVVALSLPVVSASGTVSATAPVAPPPLAPHGVAAGFSREFLDAGYEEMSTLRSWYGVLQTAIQNRISLSVALLAPYRAHAVTSLQLALAAVTTPSDRRAYQLLSNEFQNMAKLSDKYMNMYNIPPDALEKDDLNRRILACAHSLRSIAVSGQFVEEAPCS